MPQITVLVEKAFLEPVNVTDKDVYKKLREEFLPAILHGNEKHQQWLREAIECFIAGKVIPKL